jgi:hypothetical protein
MTNATVQSIGSQSVFRRNQGKINVNQENKQKRNTKERSNGT